jgi:hypothetical protein
MTDSFFGGAPSLSWSHKTPEGGYVDRPELVGVIRGGLIVEITGKQQATDMATGKPAWWEPPQGDNPGRPKLQYVLTLRCDGTRGQAMDERQSGVGNDNGDRRLFIPDGDMRKAVGDAFRANGRRDLQVGDELYLAHTGYRPSKMKGGRPAKTWAALHVPGVAPAQQWPQDAATGPVAPQAEHNPFAAQAPVQPPVPTGPAPAPQPASQPVPVAPPGTNPFGAPAPAHQAVSQDAPAQSPFAGPLPDQTLPAPAANPFAR